MNEGEVPQYYIEESHPAIIVPEEFELVQAELLRRQNLRRQYNGKSVFAARLVCGDCGNFFGAKVWHSNSKYRQVIWQCNHKFQGVCKCQTPHLQESVIQQRFQAAVQELLQKRKAILENCQVMLELLTDCTDLERQLQELEMQKMRVSEQVQGYVRENSEIVQDQESMRNGIRHLWDNTNRCRNKKPPCRNSEQSGWQDENRFKDFKEY